MAVCLWCECVNVSVKPTLCQRGLSVFASAVCAIIYDLNFVQCLRAVWSTACIAVVHWTSSFAGICIAVMHWTNSFFSRRTLSKLDCLGGHLIHSCTLIYPLMARLLYSLTIKDVRRESRSALTSEKLFIEHIAWLLSNMAFKTYSLAPLSVSPIINIHQ